jgi:hypothetical protein
VFAGAGFAFQRGDTQMWCDDAGLIEEPSNCWASADESWFWSVEGFAVGGVIWQFRFIKRLHGHCGALAATPSQAASGAMSSSAEMKEE